MAQRLTPQRLLAAYANGYFPMAESRDDRTVTWYNPDPRAILPIENFHVPRSVRKLVRSKPFRISVSLAFPEVIAACAMRDETWINQEIIALYCALWRTGHAHSIECWQGGQLIGGLYGVSIGGAFFGESMFSRMSGGSKIALVHLMARLKAAGYALCDTQFSNGHLRQFGVQEITRADYLARLEISLKLSPNPSNRFLSVSPYSG